jgi:hypothetical protein
MSRFLIKDIWNFINQSGLKLPEGDLNFIGRDRKSPRLDHHANVCAACNTCVPTACRMWCPRIEESCNQPVIVRRVLFSTIKIIDQEQSKEESNWMSKKTDQSLMAEDDVQMRIAKPIVRVIIVVINARGLYTCMLHCYINPGHSTSQKYICLHSNKSTIFQRIIFITKGSL